MPLTTPPVPADDPTAICRFVERITGIQLPATKHSMVSSRLSPVLRRLGLTRYRDYLAHVEQSPDGLREMMDVLTTNKTSFFREARHFEVLRARLADLHARGIAPRLWSAGCSSGEEPYTMAIIALAAGAPTTRILATDLSSRMLERGRAAVYEASALEEVPRAFHSLAFMRHATGVKVSDRVRALVEFAPLNLLGPWPMRGPFHAILCRNVMIYFDKPTRTALVERYRALLTPEGLLFVGLSESLTGVGDGFTLVEPGAYTR
jgi:chemotaxis protein methyltransferase CheR